MSAKDKIKDLDLMIEAFVEEERYEDCALLVKIKDKIKKHYKQQKIKKLWHQMNLHYGYMVKTIMETFGGATEELYIYVDKIKYAIWN